jgi:hypothetical protein
LLTDRLLCARHNLLGKFIGLSPFSALGVSPHFFACLEDPNVSGYILIPALATSDQGRSNRSPPHSSSRQARYANSAPFFSDNG